MLITMPAKAPILFPAQTKLLAHLGERLKDARLRRKLAAQTVADRAGTTRVTLGKVEAGSPDVTIGVYLRVMAVLGLENDLAELAKDDEVGRRLQDAELPQRAPRIRTRKSTP